MSVLQTLEQRAENKCELSGATEDLVVYALPPENDENNADKCILVNKELYNQLMGDTEIVPNQWRCLTESMWSTIPAVQVVAYRQLHALAGSAETWAQDALDMIYLGDDVKAWAEETLVSDDTPPTLDSNGTPLQAGDNVTIIKDLQVKGGGFTAKRGTAVRGISLTDNPEHIEGRVNGQRIVLVAKFLKKM